jgi:protein involved in polysaccharide export with SLBB domain
MSGLGRIGLKALQAAAVFAAILACASVGAKAQDSGGLRTAVATPDWGATGVKSNYRLGTGDKIRVIVYGEDDLGGEFLVDGNGFVSLPLIGQVKAAGMAAPDLETQITAKLADGYVNDPRVSVEVTVYRPFYVIGQVNKPGEYPFVNGMTVLNAVALAGGYTDQADDGDVYVRRNGTAKEEEVPADQTTRIYPGDVVRVSRTTFWSVVSILSPVAAVATPLAYVAVTH